MLNQSEDVLIFEAYMSSKNTSKTPELDSRGFTVLLSPKVSPEQLLQLEKLVAESDPIINAVSLKSRDSIKANAWGTFRAVTTWFDNGSPIYNYFDLYHSYVDLLNLLTAEDKGSHLYKLVKQIVSILPNPDKEITSFKKNEPGQ